VSRTKTKSGEINFYLRYSYDSGAEERKRKIRKAIMPIGIVVVAFLIVFAYFTIPALMKKSEMQNYKDYATNPTTLQQYNDAKGLVAERNEKSDRLKEYNNLLASIASMPKASEAVMLEVENSLSGATATSYSFEAGTGTLAVLVKSSSVTTLPIIVTKLKETGTFRTVTYKGYEGSDGKYTTTITCQYKYNME